MKKSIAFIVSLAVIAGLAFADDAKVAAPKATPKTEIWGAANLDHFTTGYEANNSSLGNWYFNKARVGINTQASDTVSFVSEFDLVGLDLRLFNAAWAPVDGLTVTAGKFMENYDQGVNQSRLLGAKADYDFGPAAIGIAVLNKSDITDFAYSNYGASQVTAGKVTSTAQVYGLQLKPTTNVILEPTVSVDVINSNGITLTLRADGKFDYNPAIQQYQPQTYTSGVAPVSKGSKVNYNGNTVISADASATFGIDKLLTWYNEFYYDDIGEGDEAMNFYTKATLTATPSFKPCAYVYMFNLGSNANVSKFATQSDTAVLELPYTLAKNFIVNPWGSYTFAGFNKYDVAYQDWSVGLRFTYSFSSKF